MARVLWVSPFGRKTDDSGRTIDFGQLYTTIKACLLRLCGDIELFYHQDEIHQGDIIDSLSIVDSSDLIICDITGHNSSCFYVLGYSHGRNKPTLIVTARSGLISFDLYRYHVIAYDPGVLSDDFLNQLSGTIRLAIENPSSFIASSTPAATSKKVFVSYSHKDRDYLERMLVHLKPLERAGLIDSWVDTRLKAGDLWEQNIESALQSASVAVILVSADFLASDFIVKNELPPILAKAEGHGTRIIPVVLKPCRFARDANLSKFQSLNPPDQLLSNLNENEREKVFDLLAATLEESIGTV